MYHFPSSIFANLICLFFFISVLPPFSHDVDIAINFQPRKESVIPGELVYNEASPSMVDNDVIVSPIDTPILRDIEMPTVGDCENLNDEPIPNENNSEDGPSSMHDHITNFNEEVYLSNPTIHQAMSPNIGLSTGLEQQ